VPDDLLRYLLGPAPLPSWWTWLAIVLALLLIGWYAALLFWTRPPERQRIPRFVQRAHAALLRRRFAGSVRRIIERYRTGELDAADAGAALSRTLRDFLHAATGAAAQYMQLDELAEGELSRAAPLLARINDIQFNARSTEDVAGLSGATEELILSWS
jgi:hypothetical protein